MKTELYVNQIKVKKSSIHGFGVFADQDIQAGELIEECHLLYINGHLPDLSNYEFYLDEKTQVIPLGFGGIYNHADDPNADYFLDSERNIFRYLAQRFIGKGEEIFISYGRHWFDKKAYSTKRAIFFHENLTYLARDTAASPCWSARVLSQRSG